MFAVILFLGSLFDSQPVRAEGGEPKQRRYQAGWALGSTLTPAVLFDQASGKPFRANYGAFEHGFQLAFEQDIQSMMAIAFRATFLGREITYTEPEGLSTVSRTLPILVLNAPLQLKFSPKRWFHVALGGYVEPCLSGGLPVDFGWAFGGGFDIPFHKKNNFGLYVSSTYNISFQTYDAITARQFYVNLGLRFGPNKKPNLD